MLRNIRLLYIHNFLTDFRFSAGFLTIYLAHVGGSYTLAMAILSLENIVSALMDIPTGLLSDRVGRKKTMALGSASVALALACYASALNLWVLFLGAVLHGLSMCLFNGNNNALLYETLKSANRENEFHHELGRTSSMFQIALGLSGFCAIFLVPYGLRWIVIFSIVPQILAFFVSLFFKEPRVHIHEPQKNLTHLKTAVLKVRRNPRLILMIIAQAINFGANESNFQFQTAYINTLWPTWALGLYRGLTHALSFFGFWFSGKIIDRVREPYVLVGRDLYWFLNPLDSFSQMW
jgi:MFS family permease